MRIPKYRKHSVRDLGFACFRTKRKYFQGRYDSAQSRSEYRQWLREVVMAEPQQPANPGGTIAISTLALKFLDWAEIYYPGGQSNEYDNLRHAIRPFATNFSTVLATEFGPLKLKDWLSELVKKGHCRTYINQQRNKILRMFSWGVSEELLPEAIHGALSTVPGLKRGHTEATESKKKIPATWQQIANVLQHVSPQIGDMLQVQWYTGVRSDTLVQAAGEQFHLHDGDLRWLPHHKTENRGKTLVVWIGPRCQPILRRWLAQAGSGLLWTPKAARRNPMYGSRYTTHSYRQAVQRGIRRYINTLDQSARVAEPMWSPHQIRHARGQSVRELYGLEAAQAILGHDSMDATEIYTSRLSSLARRVALETG